MSHNNVKMSACVGTQDSDPCRDRQQILLRITVSSIILLFGCVRGSLCRFGLYLAWKLTCFLICPLNLSMKAIAMTCVDKIYLIALQRRYTMIDNGDIKLEGRCFIHTVIWELFARNHDTSGLIGMTCVKNARFPTTALHRSPVAFGTWCGTLP